MPEILGKPEVALTIVVGHCQGETRAEIKSNISNAEIQQIQRRITRNHDVVVHTQSEPCQKSYSTRID